MTNQNWNDEDFDDLDEEWYDDEDSDDDEQPGRCPECGAEVYRFLEKCPDCGYWLSDADRRDMWPSLLQPNWLKTVAVAVLVIFVLSIVLAGIAFR